MDLSISCCEGQSNTCINKNTRVCACRHECCHTVVVGRPPWELVIFQQQPEYVRKCAYTVATHAGSTVLRSVAVLQHLRRLHVKHTIAYRSPAVTASVKDISLCLSGLPSLRACICALGISYLCSVSLFHHFSVMIGHEGKAIKRPVTAAALQRDKGCLWPFHCGNFHVYRLHRVSQSADKLLHEAITWFANTWFTNWPSYPYHAYIHTSATVSTPAGTSFFTLPSLQFHFHKKIFIVQVQFEIHGKATLKLTLAKPYAPLFDCFTTYSKTCRRF